jgi:hypothetical protein
MHQYILYVKGYSNNFKMDTNLPRCIAGMNSDCIGDMITLDKCGQDTQTHLRGIKQVNSQMTEIVNLSHPEWAYSMFLLHKTWQSV